MNERAIYITGQNEHRRAPWLSLSPFGADKAFDLIITWLRANSIGLTHLRGVAGHEGMYELIEPLRPSAALRLALFTHHSDTPLRVTILPEGVNPWDKSGLCD